MTLQTIFKTSFSLTRQIPLQMSIGKQLFFSCRNDPDLRKIVDSAQECEKFYLHFM